MATTIYSSKYTGLQVDAAVASAVEATTRSAIDSMTSEEIKALDEAKILIATDENTLWRSNGTSMVQIVGSGGGGTGGTSVTPYTDPDATQVLGKTRLAGLAIGTSYYNMSYISVQQTSGSHFNNDYTMLLQN